MRLQSRLKKLDDAIPKCDGRITRVVVAQEYTATEADRCPRCGGYHVLVIKRKVVARRDLFAHEGQA